MAAARLHHLEVAEVVVTGDDDDAAARVGQRVQQVDLPRLAG